MSLPPTRTAWADVPISDVANITLGKTPRRIDYQSEGAHRVLKYRDIRQNEVVLDETKDGFVSEDPHLLRSLRTVELGDVLVGASGHSSESIGRKVAIVKELPAGSPHFFAGELLGIRPTSGKLDGRWAFHFFTSEAGFRTLQDAVSGVHLTNGRARKMVIPLPPLAQQEQLCDLLDASAAVSNSARRRLVIARRATVRFRQAVLAASCSGHLTADWREAHHPIDGAETQSPVPAGWTSVTLGNLGVSIRGGTTEVPNNEPTAFPVLRSSSVRPFTVDFSDVRYLTDDQFQREENFLAEGDLLITRLSGSIEYVGNCAIVSGLKERRIKYPDRLFCCRPVNPEEAKFIELAFAAPEIREQIESASRSAAGHQRISISDLKGFHFSRPPLDEQREIVRHCSALLSLADGLLARIESASRSMDRSWQAILAKAFRGELSPSSLSVR
jgi:type I restriction enzyme, S subunit